MKTFDWIFLKLHQILDRYTSRIFEKNKGKLRITPNWIINLVFFLCASVLVQAVFDVLLKLMGYAGMLAILPWRVDFLFLTAISALIGYQTLIGMRKRKIDVTRNSVELGFIVETALIIGDLHFLYLYANAYPGITWVRLPFLILTAFNLLILVYISKKTKLFPLFTRLA